MRPSIKHMLSIDALRASKFLLIVFLVLLQHFVSKGQTYVVSVKTNYAGCGGSYVVSNPNELKFFNLGNDQTFEINGLPTAFYVAPGCGGVVNGTIDECNGNVFSNGCCSFQVTALLYPKMPLTPSHPSGSICGSQDLVLTAPSGFPDYVFQMSKDLTNWTNLISLKVPVYTVDKTNIGASNLNTPVYFRVIGKCTNTVPAQASPVIGPYIFRHDTPTPKIEDLEITLPSCKGYSNAAIKINSLVVNSVSATLGTNETLEVTLRDATTNALVSKRGPIGLPIELGTTGLPLVLVPINLNHVCFIVELIQTVFLYLLRILLCKILLCLRVVQYRRHP